MTIWMKQMKRKTREAQATYAPNLESTCLEYCRERMTEEESRVSLQSKSDTHKNETTLNTFKYPVLRASYSSGSHFQLVYSHRCSYVRSSR